MLVTASVYNMATKARSRPKPPYGQRLEARRDKVRKSLDDIADETDGRLYKQFLYRLESGKKKPHTLKPDQIIDLSHSLEWSPQELADALEIVLPVALSDSERLPQNTLPPPEPLGNLVRLPVLAAQGGTLESQTDRGREGRYEVIAEVYLDGHKPEDCAIVEAYGWSMACEDVILSLPEGTKFVIDLKQEPQEYDIVVCDLFYEDEWFRVFKIFGRTGHIVLHSYNEEYSPIVLKEGMELHRVGVYVRSLGTDQATVRRMNRQRLKAKR